MGSPCTVTQTEPPGWLGRDSPGMVKETVPLHLGGPRRIARARREAKNSQCELVRPTVGPDPSARAARPVTPLGWNHPGA